MIAFLVRLAARLGLVEFAQEPEKPAPDPQGIFLDPPSLFGMPVRLDPSVPPGEIHLHNKAPLGLVDLLEDPDQATFRELIRTPEGRRLVNEYFEAHPIVTRFKWPPQQ